MVLEVLGALGVALTQHGPQRFVCLDCDWLVVVKEVIVRNTKGLLGYQLCLQQLEFDLFLDVGSYIGYYTLYLASKYKNLEALSFEPIIESFSQVKISKEANNLDKVKIFNYALSDTKDEKKFWVTDLRKKSGFSLLDDKDLEREAKLNKYDYNKLFFKKIKTEIFDKEFTIKNKLIFLDIKELITHVESVWENIDGWWNNQNLKTIREEFCYKYSVSPPKDAVKKFSKLLIKNA